MAPRWPVSDEKVPSYSDRKCRQHISRSTSTLISINLVSELGHLLDLDLIIRD